MEEWPGAELGATRPRSGTAGTPVAAMGRRRRATAAARATLACRRRVAVQARPPASARAARVHRRPADRARPRLPTAEDHDRNLAVGPGLVLVVGGPDLG